MAFPIFRVVCAWHPHLYGIQIHVSGREKDITRSKRTELYKTSSGEYGRGNVTISKGMGKPWLQLESNRLVSQKESTFSGSAQEKNSNLAHHYRLEGNSIVSQ